MCGLYILVGSSLEKCGKFWKNGRFSERIRPDWGNTARADMAGLGSIGLRPYIEYGSLNIPCWLITVMSVPVRSSAQCADQL